MRKSLWFWFFFFLDHMQEIAFPASPAFMLLTPLNLSAAQGPGNHPAGPAGIPSTMDARQGRVRCNGADAEFVLLWSAGYPAALFKIPAVLFQVSLLGFLLRMPYRAEVF